MKRMKLVLASTSRFRRALLEAAGIPHVAVAPPYEERHDLGLSPDDLARTHARGKAESLASAHGDALIIGSDQVPELDGRVLTKPGSHDAAVEQLVALQGRTHRLITAVAVHDAGANVTHEALVVHRMTMRPFDRAQAEAYVRRDAPLDCAGAYRVEAMGALLFESMEGSDHTAIIGIPITTLSELVARCGVDLLSVSLER